MKHLTIEQRYEISAYLKCGKPKSFIAQALKVDRSTINREINRNSTKTGEYDPKKAQELYVNRKEWFHELRKFTKDIELWITDKITQEQWSPEQIVGYCKKHNIAMVSHERIYSFIRQDKANGGKLYMHLRHKLKHRKRPVSKFIPIKNRQSIDQRPEIVNKKGRFGDWEIDTIIGNKQRGAIVTITERTTNFFLMKKLKKGKNAKSLATEVIKIMQPYKAYVHTITSDNGAEFSEHEKIASALEATVYFTHPYASWEKGLIEYTNKLIRQYIPKKVNFDDYSHQKIKKIQDKINSRPRDKLGFDNPIKIFTNLAS